VDFDGTICHYAFPECGPPRAEVIEALQALRAEGWRIIIHSSRVNSHWPEPERTAQCEAMVRYLIASDVPFDEIWGIAFDGEPARDGGRICEWWFEPHLTGKPVAHVYLDDRSVSPLGDGTQPAVLAEVCRRIAERANAEHHREDSPCRR
jgi:hypothetical protein